MSEYLDPMRLPMQDHLDALAAEAGHRFDPGTLDPTQTTTFDALLRHLLDTVARHAAATHLWHLLHGPLTFLLEVIGDGPIDQHEADLQQLTALLQLPTQLRQQHQQAAADAADVFAALRAAGRLAPQPRIVPAQPDHRSQPASDHTIHTVLRDAGFLAALTEHGAAVYRYRRHSAGSTVHADLATDGSLTLHGIDPAGTEPGWHLNADPHTPPALLAALLHACTTTDPTNPIGDHPHGRLDV